MTGPEHLFDSSVADIAAIIGFKATNDYYLDFGDSSDIHDNHTSYFTLEADRPLAIGELAWYADWMVQNYPNVVAETSPQYLAHFVGL